LFTRRRIKTGGQVTETHTAGFSLPSGGLIRWHGKTKQDWQDKQDFLSCLSLISCLCSLFTRNRMILFLERSFPLAVDGRDHPLSI
jgi:hypothetical protein